MAFIELDLRSGYLNSHEEVWMILPDEKPPKDGYPVLWLFHGAHQDCSEWVRNSSVERFANERGLAVIMPTMLHSYGMDMKYGADYFPWLQGSCGRSCTGCSRVCHRKRKKISLQAHQWAGILLTNGR